MEESSCTDHSCCSTTHELKQELLFRVPKPNSTLPSKSDCEIPGISCLELGNDVEVKINGDSSAVKGILARRGCGKVNHLELKQPWLQEQVCSGKVDFQKPERCFNAPLHKRGGEETLQACGD